VGLAYDHDWSRRYPARLVRAMLVDNVSRPMALIMAPTTLRGIERLVHLDPPVIFAANHASHVDTPVLLTNLPIRFRHKTVVAAAADHFFDRRWKAIWWSLSLGAIPIERARVNRRSGDVAATLIDDGWSLVIFPEGGRSPDGWAQPFSPASAAYLSVRTGAPVVPVYLHGTHRVLPKRGDRHRAGSGSENQKRAVRRSPVTILFGTPIGADPGEDARHFSARIEGAVDLLAREVRSDWWSARRKTPEDRSALVGPDVAAWRRSWALVGPEREEHGTWPPKLLRRR
jgi:1-acyl-sn-glycerol-3-phosphate acyltransferase